MAHQQVPDDGAHPLGVRRDALGGHGGDDHAGVSEGAGGPAVAPDDAEDAGTALAGVLDRPDEIHADLSFAVSPAHREDQDAVALAQSRAAEPLDEGGLPALVV